MSEQGPPSRPTIGDLRYIGGRDATPGFVEQYDGSEWIRIFVPPTPASQPKEYTSLRFEPGIGSYLRGVDRPGRYSILLGQAATDDLLRKLDQEFGMELDRDDDAGG
jgi:hypothetical protein